MQKLLSLCKRRGIIYSGSEIYGGLANSWHYGPLGVQIKKNIKDLWWKHFVEQREDILGLDSSIIMNPRVWQGSGHLKGFTDPLVECKYCHKRFRADHLVGDEKWQKMTEEQRRKKFSTSDQEGYMQDQLPACPACEKERIWTLPQDFNLMFKTFIGAVEDKSSLAYLRPETAQGMFTDFKIIQQAYRKRLPFGLAQIGKSFRNEITPGNFIFRVLEFEQMEIEYFIKEKEWEKYFTLWQNEMEKWLKDILGLRTSNFTTREHQKEELSHYSKKTIDFEYKYPFGQKELYGLAYRTDFDLKAHIKESGADLSYTDEQGQKIVPHVIEPSFGLERTILAVLCDALEVVKGARTKTTAAKQEEELVLRLNTKIAPIKAAILPLSRKPKLVELGHRLYQDLIKNRVVEYDETGSIGKRYRRQDEIGTPFCITIDFDSLKDRKATVRDRDTMEQKRISIDNLEDYLEKQLKK